MRSPVLFEKQYQAGLENFKFTNSDSIIEAQALQLVTLKR
jgi:hypothetical protein